jgi:outer membrane protein assembly factor BamA
MYLDEDRGLRGAPLHYRGGEDRVVINVEERFFSEWEILSVGLGAVLFADIGNIWNRNTASVFSDFDTSVGTGLRFGVSRSTRGEVVRVDAAYALRQGRWQLSVGTGQFF